MVANNGFLSYQDIFILPILMHQSLADKHTSLLNIHMRIKTYFFSPIPPSPSSKYKWKCCVYETRIDCAR